MNSTASHKPSPKCPSELLKGANRTFPQTIKPFHCHRLQIGWEHLVYQGLVPKVNGNPLIEVAHMFYKFCSAIIHGERWLSKSPRKFSTFNHMGKR